MTAAAAILAGYTVEYMAECIECDLHIFVKPDTDLDSTFRAYDADDCGFVHINGWLWSFEELTQ